MVLHAGAWPNYDFTHTDGQTMILLTLACYKIYGFVASASQNFEFTYIGKLPNLWFCSPGHSKTMILLTLASHQSMVLHAGARQNHDFTYIGKLPNLWFCCQSITKLRVYLHWQATKSMVLLPRAQQNMSLRTLTSQGKAKL